HAGCTTGAHTWKPATGVLGAGVAFAAGASLPAAGFTATAEEDATYRAELVKLDGRATFSRDRRSAVASAAGLVKAYHSPKIRVGLPSRVTAGSYAYRVELRAALNPARATVVLSRPFRVGAPARKDK